jgi:hypothetical protein
LKIFAEGTAPSRTATYRGFAIRGAVFAACLTLFAILAAFISPQRIAAQQQAASASPSAPTQDYLVYVVCESADKVVLLRFGPKGIKIERETRIGLLPMGDINGPHGIAVSPDKEYVYVSLGHGQPNGSAWKLKRTT